MLLQFSEKYPTSAIIVELKSKTLPPRLLAKMTELCDQEAKKLLGKPQVGIAGGYSPVRIYYSILMHVF